MIINPQEQSLKGSGDDSELRLKGEEKAFDRAAVHFLLGGFRRRLRLENEIKVWCCHNVRRTALRGRFIDGFRAISRLISIND
jgi:hypothetical protein